MRVLLSFVALLFVAPFFVSAVDEAGAQDTRRTISVTGEGVVTVEPDQAIVRFGVVSTHKDPEEARRMNAAASRDAMNAVRELGIEERKIKLEMLRLEPDRRFNQTTQTWDEIGFIATRDVRVTLDDLEQLPTVVARVVQKGANRLNGIAYTLLDQETVKMDAMKKAAANARVKAELLASELGATVGYVLTISEQGVYIPGPQLQYAEMAMMRSQQDAAPEPAAYAAGEMEVRANVSVVFELR